MPNIIVKKCIDHSEILYDTITLNKNKIYLIIKTMTKKTKLRTIGMIPWSILIILYFIWANQNEFSISKNALGVLLTPMTGILWFSVVATFTDAILEEQN